MSMRSRVWRAAPTINFSVLALRFFFTVTLDRPDLSRRLVLVRHPRKLPTLLSVWRSDVCSRRRGTAYNTKSS
jgi:hypothetical protein